MNDIKNIFVMFLGLWTILLPFSIGAFYIKKKQAEWIRICFQFIIQFTVVLSIVLHAQILVLLVSAIIYLGTNEFFNILCINKNIIKDSLVKFYILIAVSLLPIVNYYFQLTPYYYSIIVFILLQIILITKQDQLNSLKLTGVFLISLTFAVMLNFFVLLRLSQNGIILCFFVYSMVIFTDISAYVIGNAVKGKIKIAKHINPHKTLEVVLLCYLFVIGMAILYKLIFFHSYTIWSISLFALVISISSQIGDFVFSMIKRALNIKDFSNIFPGIGGVWDHFDSLIFAAAIFYLLISSERIFNTPS